MKFPSPLLPLGLAACVGAWLGCEYPVALWWYPALFLAFTVSGLWLRGRLGTVSVWLAGAAAFMCYADARHNYFPPNHLAHVAPAPGAVELRLRALEDATLTVTARGARRLEFTARVLTMRGEETPVTVSGLTRVLLREPGALTVSYGDELRAAGYLQPIAPPTEPGEFDAQNYYRIRGVRHEFLADPALTVNLGGHGGNWLRQLAFALRRHMGAALTVGLEDAPDTTALLRGLLFGDTGALADDTKAAFRVTGTQHVFAVSGLHVATLLAALLVTLDLTGATRWRWAWLALPALLVFCLATGLRPSAFRALVMIALVIGGWLLLRPAGVLNLLGAAALVLLAWEPGQVLDKGFQLSFCAVAGLAVGGGFFFARLYRPWQPDPWIPRRLLTRSRLAADRAARVLCAAVATSLSAWLATLPILLWDFHIVSPVTPLANLVVVPLATLCMTVAALTVTLGWLWHGFPLLLNQVNWLVLKGMVGGAVLCARLPGAFFYVGADGVPDGAARFTFFKQEELAPALLQYRGGNWLLGTGPEFLWRYRINPYRRSLGINAFDGVILPRGGARAAGAAASVSGEVRAGFWAESGGGARAPSHRQWLDRLAVNGVARQFWRRGDELVLSENLRVTVLWPPADAGDGDQHDSGLVLLFSTPGGTLLHAGNISRHVEALLVAADGDRLRADCLAQGPHNGSGNLSRDWLRAVRPRHLIRPARGYFADNSLTRELWQTARELGIEVWRMEDCGSLVLEYSAAGVTLRAFKEGSPRRH
jgi:competence protein ComEC